MRQPVPFGKYLLLDRISVGGMAEVFKAKSYGVEGFEKIIAIKRILPTMGEDRDFIKMFIDEAKIAGQLAHANICQIFELGRIDGSHFIAMEYIWGKDLLQIQNRLRKIKQPMPVAMACFCIAKVLEGLDYAHRKRDPLGRPLEIVHRDCSPQNVLVSYEGEVKVIDFGIAKATSRNSRTMAGVLKGKFGYMSPEQVRGLPLDRRSDIFAIGTMLYECLTSERLFQGETDFSTLEKVRNVDIRPPRELNPNIPEVVERVILKALAKDVDDRYQWCSEMLADLQQYLMGQDVVFTAKSLSSWLKEVFTAEIDKERQLLEQYKRVGRDGLIAGMPSAEAKLDVNEHLGEAPAAEGDATMLGGPNFDDLEVAVAASAALEVGPAPGSPAALGSAPDRAVARADADDDGDFGEEAPTEIFGEIDDGPKPAMLPPLAQPQGIRSPRPSVPPMRPGSSSPMAMGNGSPMAAAPSDKTINISDGDAAQGSADAREAYAKNFPGLAPPAAQPGYAAQGYAQNGQGGYGMQMPNGTPSSMSIPPPQALNALAPAGSSQGKTLMGAAAPPGLPTYGTYPPYQNPSQPGLPGVAPAPGQMPPGYPSAQNYLGQMHGSQGPMASQPYGSQIDPYNPNAAGAVDQVREGRKKSSIGRDIAIGVMIAAVVLGGFLAVKFLILDGEDDAGSTAGSGDTAGEIATLRIEMPENVTAELFLDDATTREASVKNGSEIAVSAGQRKIRIVAPNGQRCEQELTLPAKQVVPVVCNTMVANAGSAVAKADPTKADPTKADPTKADPTKAADKVDSTKPDPTKVEPKPDPTKPDPTKVVDKTKPDPTKLTVKPPDPTKPPDKTKPDPTKVDKVKPPRPPTEDNPADKLAAMGTKGFLAVTSNPSAKIAVDGIESGKSTPIGKLPLSIGRHKITFTLGGDKFTFSVTIKAGETTTLHKDLQ